MHVIRHYNGDIKAVGSGMPKNATTKNNVSCRWRQDRAVFGDKGYEMRPEIFLDVGQVATIKFQDPIVISMDADTTAKQLIFSLVIPFREPTHPLGRGRPGLHNSFVIRRKIHNLLEDVIVVPTHADWPAIDKQSRG